MLVPVQGRFEGDSVLIDEGQAFLPFGDDLVGLHSGHIHGQGLLESRSKGEDLESAGIRVGGAIPVHEPGKSACLVQNILAGTFKEVEGVRQKHLGTHFAHLLGQHGLHGGLGGHRDESRRMNIAVGGMDDSGPAVPPPLAAQSVCSGGQLGDGFEREGGTVARSAGFRSQGIHEEGHGFTVSKSMAKRFATRRHTLGRLDGRSQSAFMERSEIIQATCLSLIAVRMIIRTR